ncbi:MAG: hypothetical protein Q3965_05200 [Rothia sp. (in: high G+C Gram-positive bacteria)]|nr:hypothetical protein [Rothia sp. (in: high G+C Gram-positive bacteria)]
MPAFKSKFVAIPSVALLSLAVLAGCGSNDNKESKPAESRSSSVSSSAAVSESASASESASVEASLPEGYKSVSATNNGISFGVPEDWVELNAEAVASNSDMQEYLDQTATELGLSAEQLKQQMAQLDLMATSTKPDASGFANNVNVLAEPVPAKDLPTEAQTQQLAEGAKGTPGEYAEVDTALGKGVTQTYTMEAGGVKVNGVFLLVPAGDGAGYSVITVSASDASAAKEIVDNIAKSVDKA